MYDSTEDTLKHIENVQMFINQVVDELVIAGETHDASKLEEPEKSIVDIYTPKLKNTTYGSEEYKQHLKEMGSMLDHHYKENRHHPEHFKDYYVDGKWSPLHAMNLIDIVEMLCDWKAASLRHADGDIRKSIEINQKRFGYSDEMKSILLNTVNMFGW